MEKLNSENKRSLALKKRHENARFQRELYRKEFSDEKEPSYFDFMRKETPLESKIVAYDVSYQISYTGTENSFISNPKTFKVYGFAGQESEIQKRTMNMVLDSKGSNTGTGFSSGTLDMLEQNIKTDIFPRGMEESKNNLEKNELSKVFENGFFVKDLDSKLKFKNKKREGQQDLDISHFM